MNIGIDIDGVLANFVGGAKKLVKKHFGIDMRESDHDEVKHYDWYKDYLSDSQTNKFWKVLKATEDFWLNLQPTKAFQPNQVLNILNSLRHSENIYFISSALPTRGLPVTKQREAWLESYGILDAQVIITKDKVKTAKDLGVKVFLEDSPYWIDQLKKAGLKVFIISYPYNAGRDGVYVPDLGSFLNFFWKP